MKNSPSLWNTVSYTTIHGANKEHNVTVYSLSTCPHCFAAKKFLKDKGISFDYMDVDTSTRDEKKEITLFLKRNTLPFAFPVIVIDDKIVIGFKKEEIEALLDA
ncbi:glutaredoxin family protein [Thermoproteota archaeon]